MRCTLREHHRQQQQQQICSPNIDLSIIRCELCPTDCCVALAFFFFGKYFAHAAHTWHFFGVSCALLFHTAAAADWSSTNEKKKEEKHDENLVCHLQFWIVGHACDTAKFSNLSQQPLKVPTRATKKKLSVYVIFFIYFFLSRYSVVVARNQKLLFSYLRLWRTGRQKKKK